MANTFPLPLGTSAASVEDTNPHADSGSSRSHSSRPSSRPHSRAALPLTLSAVAVGTPAHVVALELDDELRAWLRAVGIREGERVTLLRRAVFGGPIHVRTRAGGEFALNRQPA